jgi:hypothetical protein
VEGAGATVAKVERTEASDVREAEGERPSLIAIAQKPTIMERLGVRYLARLVQRQSAATPAVLDSAQRAGLESIRRRAVFHALAVGAIYGTLVGVAETYVRRRVGLDDGVTNTAAVVRFWEIFSAIAIPASIVEIVYLWALSLRAVHAIADIADLELFDDPTAPSHHAPEGAAVAGSMARAALELPNPKRPLQIGGEYVDPMREASKLRLTLASIAYKLKIGVTKFVFKAVVRRMLVRAALRVWAPLVAIPVTAIWSGVIVWLVVREARVRALGPSAVQEMLTAVFDGAPELSPAGRLVAMRAIAACIVRSKDLHPNLVVLLQETETRVGALEDRDDAGDAPLALDHPERFLDELEKLPFSERRVVLRLLSIAAVLDGRFSSAEARLVREAQATAALPIDLEPVARLQSAFLSGRPIDPSDVIALA